MHCRMTLGLAVVFSALAIFSSAEERGVRSIDFIECVCGYSNNFGFKTFKTNDALVAENAGWVVAYHGYCSQRDIDNFCNFNYRPVCGSSPTQGYKTFHNKCYLNLESVCSGGDYSFVHDGECTPPEVPEYVCPGYCPQEYIPMCGYSYNLKTFNTFDSRCDFLVENTCNGGDYIIAHSGPCSGGEVNQDCKRCCADASTPMCAYSPSAGYQSYDSLCLFNREQINFPSDFVFLHMEACTSPEGIPPNCPAPCTKEYFPVCGFNVYTKQYHTFSNKCTLDSLNQCQYDLGYEKVDDGACQTEGGVDCKQPVATDENPVCVASPTFGYINYKNIDYFIRDISCNNGDGSLAHVGPCGMIGLTPGCPVICPTDDSPVCVYSFSRRFFFTMKNRCALDAANLCSFDNDLVYYSDGFCGNDEITNNCARTCPYKSGEVCGFSPTYGFRTTQDLCTLILFNTCYNGDFALNNYGKCDAPDGLPFPPCAVVCTYEEDNPVCGYSISQAVYNTFSNPCQLTVENKCFGGDYVQVYDGECDGTCNHPCFPEYFPVCSNYSQGFTTFPNYCELAAATCNNPGYYSFSHEGECTPGELNGSCSVVCYLTYIGICGYSKSQKKYTTFANECFMARQNACTGSDYVIAFERKCSLEEMGGVCDNSCQKAYYPLCGKSDTKGFRTFKNYCKMEKENTCNNEYYNVVHQGECLPSEICYNCG